MIILLILTTSPIHLSVKGLEFLKLGVNGVKRAEGLAQIFASQPEGPRFNPRPRRGLN